MSDKFQNKYRIPSARLQNWDYGSNAMYFVTICTQNRENYFGNVVDGKMVLSNVGIIADILWYEIKNHSKNIELGQFVVMPNHVHGVLIICGNDIESDATDDVNVGTTHVETTHALSLSSQPSQPNQSSQSIPTSQPPQQTKTIGQQRFQNQGKNTLSSLIGSYKSAVSKHAHRIGFDFAWQPRFHDHIIRNDESFQRISEYIQNNPLNWTNDKFNDLAT
jgi:putative transposase